MSCIRSRLGYGLWLSRVQGNLVCCYWRRAILQERSGEPSQSVRCSSGKIGRSWSRPKEDIVSVFNIFKTRWYSRFWLRLECVWMHALVRETTNFMQMPSRGSLGQVLVIQGLTWLTSFLMHRYAMCPHTHVHSMKSTEPSAAKLPAADALLKILGGGSEVLSCACALTVD